MVHKMSFIGTVKELLQTNPKGMTPQQIRHEIIERHPHLFGTETHRRNVAKGHYKDLEHAVLAQIYSETRNDRQISVDKSCKPMRLTLIQDAKIPAPEEAWDDHGDRKEAQADIISSIKPPEPTPDAILKSLSEWAKLENYRLQESALNFLFQKLCPKNNEIEDVLLKVCVLNDFYSTNIFDKTSAAKHLLKANIDERLKKADLSLVNDIAPISIRGSIRRCYSFASKYCSHHMPSIYPIFDNYVERMLLHYKKRDAFYSFDKSDLKDYKSFSNIIHEFQRFYKLESFSLREIDIFLWLSGKSYSPKKYKKAK